MLRIVDGDVVGAVKQKKIAELAAYARYKKKLKNLVDNYTEHYTMAGGWLLGSYCWLYQ